jgi:hypothetical protein
MASQVWVAERAIPMLRGSLLLVLKNWRNWRTNTTFWLIIKMYGRKRGRKTKAKVGRKKSKTTETKTVEITTPRTRAVVAREAATKEAATRATSANEAASASEPPSKRYDPLFPVLFCVNY